MQVIRRSATMAVIAAALAASTLASVPAAAASTFDGGYTGRYSGVLDTIKVNGDVALQVTNGAITVSQPVSGKGTVGTGGDATFGGVLSGLGYTCTFTGRFATLAGITSATGKWSCGSDGNGTWDAKRTSSPSTSTPSTTPATTTPTTAKPPSQGSATATRGTLTIKRANGKVERGRSLTLQPGDRLTTGARDAVRLDLPGRGRVDVGPGSALIVGPDGGLGGMQGAVMVILAAGGGDGLRLATGSGPTGRAIVAFSDGSKIELGPNGSFVVESHNAEAMSVKGMLGVLKATITKFGKRRFEVRTPTACACVRGTAFTMTATAATTTLETTQGVVAFTNLTSGASVNVAAGQRSTMTGAGAPSPPTKSRP